MPFSIRKVLRWILYPVIPLLRRITDANFDFLLRLRRGRFSRLMLVDLAMDFVNDCGVDGCYMEFGCFTGGSLIDAFHAARHYDHLSSMRFYVFDSFQGLPHPVGLDAGESLRYSGGQYACDLDDYKENVRKRGVDMDRVVCVPGWYNETLNDELKGQLPIKKAAVVLIDCDLYESTVPVLDFITGYIQDGTIIIFDDWFSFKGRLDLGEARAFYEWLSRNPSIYATEYHKMGRTMTSFILQVDSQASGGAL